MLLSSCTMFVKKKFLHYRQLFKLFIQTLFKLLFRELLKKSCMIGKNRIEHATLTIIFIYKNKTIFVFSN